MPTAERRNHLWITSTRAVDNRLRAVDSLWTTVLDLGFAGMMGACETRNPRPADARAGAAPAVAQSADGADRARSRPFRRPRTGPSDRRRADRPARRLAYGRGPARRRRPAGHGRGRHTEPHHR